MDMDAWQPLDERTFLADLGKGEFALAVTSSPPARASADAAGTSRPQGSVGPTGQTANGSSDAPGGAAGSAVTWERVNLGFVSAYILVRGGEAAIVDTGVEGSADEIEASLAKVGLGWAAVGHLVLTHHHRDHAGSAADVMDRAPDVAGYAGVEDIPVITVPRPLAAVGDGDAVFGLRIVTTPGHTAGSISVLDPASGLLVAGDAMRTDDGKPVLPPPQATADMDEAKRSIVKLGGLAFETLLVGHGEPLVGGASSAVAALGAG